MAKVYSNSGTSNVLQGSYQTLIGHDKTTKVLDRMNSGWPKISISKYKHNAIHHIMYV